MQSRRAFSLSLSRLPACTAAPALVQRMMLLDGQRATMSLISQLVSPIPKTSCKRDTLPSTRKPSCGVRPRPLAGVSEKVSLGSFCRDCLSEVCSKASMLASASFTPPENGPMVTKIFRSLTS